MLSFLTEGLDSSFPTPRLFGSRGTEMEEARM